MHHNRRLIQIILAVAVLITVGWVIRGLRDRTPEPLPADFSADGLGMTQTIFDIDNRRMIELKSSESRQGKDDRIHMKNLEALVLKHGRMSEDIRIHGDEGYVENNYHNFLIQTNAKVSSPKFSLESSRFFLKNRAQLSTEKAVSFRLNSMKGNAGKGMIFYIRHNVIKLFGARGIHRRQGVDYSFQADTFWFMENERKLILEKNARIQGPDSLLQGDWISITFDEDMEKVINTRCQGHAHLRRESGETDQKSLRDIRCGILNAQHGEDGKISSLSLTRNGIVHIQDPKRQTRIVSDIIQIHFEPGGDLLKKVELPSPGEVNHRGSTNFSASSQRMNLVFKQGELEQWQGEGDCRLRSAEFSCRSDSITYSESRKTLRLKGEESRVIQSGNVFLSPGFTMHTEKKWLRSEEGVRTTFHPENTQPPFSQGTFFVRSKEMTYFDRNHTIHFKGSVQLIQDSARLTCGELFIKNGKHIMAKRKAMLSFDSESDKVSVGGELIVFDPDLQSLVASGSSMLVSGLTHISADTLAVDFLKNNRLRSVKANKDVRFQKEETSGSGDQIEWNTVTQNMRFSGNATLSRKNGGNAEGEILYLDLKTNAVRVLSRRQRRTVTVLE